MTSGKNRAEPLVSLPGFFIRTRFGRRGLPPSIDDTLVWSYF